MIHKRFNYSRHLIWAGVFLTVFVSSAVTHRDKENNTVKQEAIATQHIATQNSFLNTVAQK